MATLETGKLESLRAAIQEGIDQLNRGEGIYYASMDELDHDIDHIRDEVLAESQPIPRH